MLDDQRKSLKGPWSGRRIQGILAMTAGILSLVMNIQSDRPLWRLLISAALILIGVSLLATSRRVK